MKAIEILAELCQRLRWVEQHKDIDLPHEHKRIAELLELGKEDSDVSSVADLVKEKDVAAALESAVKAHKSRRDDPKLWEAKRQPIDLPSESPQIEPIGS